MSMETQENVMQLDLKIAVPIALTGGLLTGWLAGIVATPHLVTPRPPAPRARWPMRLP